MKTAINLTARPVELTGGAMLGAYGRADVDEVGDHERALSEAGTIALVDADEQETYGRWQKPQLESEVARRGLDVEGTGRDGAVLVDDLRNALRADDAATAGGEGE